MQPVRCQGCKDAATPWTHLIKDLKVVEANLLADWENRFWDSCYLLILVVSSYDFSHTLIVSYLSLHAAACCHKMLEVLAVFFQSRHRSGINAFFVFLHSPAFSVVDTPSSEQESLGLCLKLLAKGTEGSWKHRSLRHPYVSSRFCESDCSGRPECGGLR